MSTHMPFQSLNDLVQWIKTRKGDDAQMAALILATALKIKGQLRKDNVCAVERVTRDDVPGDPDRRERARNLSGVVQDANRVQMYFTKQEHMIESNMVVQRPNEGRMEMMSALHKRFATQGVDVIFLYYTGHGTEPNGDWAIAKKEEQENDDIITLVGDVKAGREDEQENFDLIELDDVLGEWELGKEARKQGCELVIIADTCHSGAWVNEINRKRNSVDLEERATVANVSMVASCRASEVSYETAEGGDFTTYLLRPLRSSTVYTKNITAFQEDVQDHTDDGDDYENLEGKVLKELWIALTRSRRRLQRNTGKCLNYFHHYMEMFTDYGKRVYDWAFDMYISIDPCIYLILVLLFSPCLLLLYFTLYCCCFHAKED